MKRIYLWIFLLLAAGNVLSQNNIVHWEYWIDDYTSKVQNDVSPPQSTYNLQETVLCQSLTPGLHTFSARFMDSNGRWSSTVTSSFYKVASDALDNNAIVAYEYWIDDYNSKVPGDVSPQATYNLQLPVSCSNLTPGLHTFSVRFKDVYGAWSSTVTSSFYKVASDALDNNVITAYEYWIDDYANKVSKPANSQAVFNLTDEISLQDLPVGVHSFNIRFKDAYGRWSGTASQYVYKYASDVVNRNITAYEYWFNNDYDHKVRVEISPQQNFVLLDNVNCLSLTQKVNTLSYRFLDDSGLWSSTVTTPSFTTPISTWTPTPSSTDWNEADNWTPTGVPDANSVVIIPGPDKASAFPDLTASATIDEIRFAPSAELGGQDFLSYNKAYVQLDFSSTGLARNRWWMLTNPLQQLFAADFAFGGYPGVTIQSFVSSNGLNAWKAFSDGFKHEFGQGDNFEIWYGQDNSTVKGLSVAGDIITLPYFEDPSQADVHWTHVYNPVTKTSEYSNIGVSVLRDPNKAYKLADGVFTKDLDFGKGLDQYYYAATGNPFMSSISFNKLQTANSQLISGGGYWVWVGPATTSTPTPGGYANYNAASGSTVGNIKFGDLSDIIPPMQSFIVARNLGTTVAPRITFNIANISATGKNMKGRLREAAQSNDLLEITASTPQSGARAVIASREGGSLKFNDSDSRMLFTDINTLPAIYMLKQSANNSTVAVAADILSDIKEDVVIPLGIYTTYEGSITLSFAGADTYNARIFLIDNNKEIELTGKAKYDYTFNYVPEKVNGTAVRNESRFSVRLSPMVITGIESDTASNILVFSRSAGTVQVVSGEAIRQITVIDMQGRKVHDNPAVNTNEYTVTGLAAGVYVVKAVTGNEVKTTKIIVR